MSEDWTRLYDSIAELSPKVIESQKAMRRDGPVVENQIIELSQNITKFANNIRNIWTHCAGNIETISLRTQNSNEVDETIQNYCRDVIQNIGLERKKEKKWAELEGFVRDKGVEKFLNLLALYAGVKDDFTKDNIVIAVESFLQWNTQIRWTRNVKNHYEEYGYELKPHEIEGVLKFLNQDDFDILLKNIAIGSIISYSLIEHDYETEDFTFTEKCDEIITRMVNACSSFDESSLAVYQKRLGTLEWGPKNYTRNPSFIRNVNVALSDNKIIAFYGLGGVGKTALAQKLMSDIIDRCEPYTHIVTFSSKVGSDQKEINTISLKDRGSKVETDTSNSVMESSILEIDGVRTITGLRTLLLKIYKETTQKNGSEWPVMILRKKVFEELQKPENQVLIVIDNYEDIEDNQSDRYVLQMKEEIKSFLEDFSKLENTKSRIIITTRSSPLDVAYGIQVKHLTKSEASNLFVEKIRFRAIRSNKEDSSINYLQEIHQLFSNNQELQDELIESFDLWDSIDDYIAHPLLVLLAAEEVEKNDKDHIIGVIKDWGDGTKNADVIEYCVSKTFGSFEEYERKIVEILTLNSNLNTEISISMLSDLIDKHVSKGEQSSLTDRVSDGQKISDPELIDIMHRLCDRTFVRVVSNRSNSGGTCWSWNKIVYEYLKNIRFKQEQIQEIEILEGSEEEELGSCPEFFKPIKEWNNSNPLPISMTDLVNPLEKSVDLMLNEITSRIDGQRYSYNLSSIEDNLGKQSVELKQLLDKVDEYMKLDPSLKSLQAGNKKIGQTINLLLRLLGRQARCWRTLASINNSKIPPQMCLKVSIRLLNIIQVKSHTFHSKDILISEEYLNLMTHFAREHIVIHGLNIEMNGTDFEFLSSDRLDWLEASAEFFNPQETKLVDGLEFTTDEFEFFKTWAELFSVTNLEDQNIQLAKVESFAFWIYLRLFATDGRFADQTNIQIINELKHRAKIVRNIPNIDQYIRSVQNGTPRVLWDSNEYLDEILNFKSPATNGTLIYVEMNYNPNNSRWEANLDRKGWKIVILETDQNHKQRYYGKVIVEQQEIHRTNKRITCSFYLDEDDNVMTEPESSMRLMVHIEEVLIEKIDLLIEERKQENRNDISLFELMKIFKETVNKTITEEYVLNTISKITDLTKENQYYVIDQSKPHTPPPPRYQEHEGWEKIFSAKWNRDRIILPLDPYVFVSYLEKFLKMLETESNMNFRKYKTSIRKDFGDNDGAGAFYIYWALKKAKRYDSNWLDVPIGPNGEINLESVKLQFIDDLERSVIGLCDRFKHKINKQVVKSYFNDVKNSFN